MMYPTEYFTLDAKALEIDTGEMKRRLSVSGDFDLSVFCDCVEKVKGESAVKCCYTRLPVTSEDGLCDLGFVKAKSADLSKNLSGCREAFVFAVTLGHGIDRLLSKLSHLSPSQHFICDAVCSALAEAAADAAEEKIRGNIPCRPRFSVGYGDFDIKHQKDILSCLNAQKLLGITLSEGFLMSPQKSITAVMGIIKK